MHRWGGGMSMPGSGHVRLHRKLETLQKRAAAGDEAAAGQAALLARHLESVAEGSSKKEDDRVKVICGAWLGAEIASGRAIAVHTPRDLLHGLDSFLVRPSERLAILGEDGRGSTAFRRVFGPDHPPPPDR